MGNWNIYRRSRAARIDKVMALGDRGRLTAGWPESTVQALCLLIHFCTYSTRYTPRIGLEELVSRNWS